MNHRGQKQSRKREHRKGDHGDWMMIACFVPMIVVAGVLAATGLVSAFFLLVAVACLAMMAAMMTMIGVAGAGKRH